MNQHFLFVVLVLRVAIFSVLNKPFNFLTLTSDFVSSLPQVEQRSYDMGTATALL